MGVEDTAARAERLYDQIKAIAIKAMTNERPDHTLQPTAVASEAFLRLSEHRDSWDSDEHFMFAVVSTVRRVLVDYAKRRGRLKRGGGWVRVEFPDHAEQPTAFDVLVLDDLLQQLAERDREAAVVFEATVFGGMNDQRIAMIMDRDEDEIRRIRRRARAWLASMLSQVS
ncbi:MAG: hypothetical protein KDA28_02140 [Phycisphaerales bacterium]|nr:hypothetical protein [Phycisphaerales bacterium]